MAFSFDWLVHQFQCVVIHDWWEWGGSCSVVACLLDLQRRLTYESCSAFHNSFCSCLCCRQVSEKIQLWLGFAQNRFSFASGYAVGSVVCGWTTSIGLYIHWHSFGPVHLEMCWEGLGLSPPPHNPLDSVCVGDGFDCVKPEWIFRPLCFCHCHGTWFQEEFLWHSCSCPLVSDFSKLSGKVLRMKNLKRFWSAIAGRGIWRT